MVPNVIRIKHHEEPADAKIGELCTKAKQDLLLLFLLLFDEWSRDCFTEMSTEPSEKFLSVLTRITENEDGRMESTL